MSLARHRLTKLESGLPGSPAFLRSDDVCLYYGDYTPGGGYQHSATNSLIFNFKKSLEKKGTAEWPYKEGAIRQAAHYLAAALNPEWLRVATLVPIPPSKAKSDPLYDDRLLQMLQAIEQVVGFKLDIRELIVQTTSTRSSSQSNVRLTPDELRAVYSIDDAYVEATPRFIGVFDDLITAGCHFRVAKDLLTRRFPGVEVTGCFIARTVHKDESLPAIAPR